jgi:carnitine-CoA ligase
MSPPSLRRAFEDRVARHPDRLAVRFGPSGERPDELRQSYAELNTSIDRAVRALRELGAKAGSRVALMLPNGPEMVWCWLALAKLGATMVPVNTRLKGDSLRYLLGHAEPDLAVVGGEPLRPFAEARRVLLDAVGATRASPARGVIRVGPPVDGETERWPTLAGLMDAVPSAPPSDAPLPLDGLASIMYTSGTTGRPKGVLIGRQAQLRQGLNYGELLGIREQETAYAFLPLFHCTAMGTTLGSLLAGANVAIDPTFTPFGFWERTRHYGAVVFSFVGSVLTLLYNRPPRPDDADNPVRRAMGAATAPQLWEPFERRFSLEIVETYGQTEMMSLWTMPPPAGSRVGTVGKPAHDRFDMKIADPDGRPLPPSTRGEIAIRPADPGDMAIGYFKEPEATADAFRPDGWYYTGDLGERDQDGYYRYIGRLRDCIRRRGENIAAYEIEQVVNAHPRVLESAAVGIPSPLGEEEVKLCVVPRPSEDDTPFDPRDLHRYCRAELPSFMVPRYIQLRDSLPKTATQRVQKATLRDEGPAGCWHAGRTTDDGR